METSLPIRELLLRWLLPKLIAKVCESRIPRSGKKGEAVNCYVIAIDKDSQPYFMATGLQGDDMDIMGLKWDGERYAENMSISLSEFMAGELEITHYYGLATITYDSIYTLAWNYLTRLIYIRIRIERFIDSTFQYFYNKKKLITQNRIALLQLMMEDQLDRAHDGIALISLMKRIYSERLFLHPSWDSQLKKVRFYLDSLVESGDVKEVGGEYVVEGQAIATLEKYEEDERRHAEAVKMQRKIFWLTIIGVIIAVVQADVVKLPTVLDFTGDPSDIVTKER